LICVIDSNVLISAFQFEGQPLQVVDHVLEEHELAVCAAILHEVRVALKEKFNWPEARIDDVFSDFFDEALLVEIHGRLQGVCRDFKDDMVLECAVAAGARVILTGEKDLLILGEYEGIRILTPRAFLKEFAEQSEP
jgi:putative PIN family toxin of toxin-antitoxin system